MTTPQTRPHFQTATDHRYRSQQEQALITTMLPAIRTEFRDILPDEKTPYNDMQDRIRRVTLQALLSKAQIVSQALGLIDTDDAYHTLGTTRDIYDDLRDFYEYHGRDDRAGKAKDICARQNRLYSSLGSFTAAAKDLHPDYFGTQLIVGRFVRDIVPAVQKPSAPGFGQSS